MATEFSKLWEQVRTAADEAESVRTLAKILSSKDGRTFIVENLGLSDAELCIEILDCVSFDPSSASLMDAYQHNDILRVWRSISSTRLKNKRSLVP